MAMGLCYLSPPGWVGGRLLESPGAVGDRQTAWLDIAHCCDGRSRRIHSLADIRRIYLYGQAFCFTAAGANLVEVGIPVVGARAK